MTLSWRIANHWLKLAGRGCLLAALAAQYLNLPYPPQPTHSDLLKPVVRIFDVASAASRRMVLGRSQVAGSRASCIRRQSP